LPAAFRLPSMWLGGFLLFLLGFTGGIFLLDADDRPVNGAYLHFGYVLLAGGLDIELVDELTIFLFEFFFLNFAGNFLEGRGASVFQGDLCLRFQGSGDL